MTETIATVTTDDGFTISSNAETAEALTESHKSEDGAGEDLSKAASTLGKKGGKAAAEARKEAAKDETAETGRVAKGDVDSNQEGVGSQPGDSAGAEVDAVSAADDKEKADTPEEAKSRSQRRVEQATREAAEAKRERDSFRAEKDRLAAELAQARAGKPAEQPQPAPQQAQGDPRPVPDNYETWQSYEDALLDWRDRRRDMELVHQIHAAEVTKAVKEVVQTFTESMDQAEKADPAYADRVRHFAVRLKPSFRLAEGEPLQAIHIITDELLNSKQLAPALMLHLAEHPEDVKQLEAMPKPQHIQMWMAELRGLYRARLDSATAGTPLSNEHPVSKLEVSRAKPPVRPVAGSPHTADAVPDPDASSFDEHLRFYNAKERRAR